MPVHQDENGQWSVSFNAPAIVGLERRLFGESMIAEPMYGVCESIATACLLCDDIPLERCVRMLDNVLNLCDDVQIPSEAMKPMRRLRKVQKRMLDEDNKNGAPSR